MCTTATCCFNLSPPAAASKSSRLPCSSLASPPSWRSQGCAAAAVGLAYAMIGIGFVENMRFFSGEGAAMAEEVISARVVRQQGERRPPERWSDRCPPWKAKTFELIMPERLPRPSPRRRWESIGDFDQAIRGAARSKEARGSSNRKCFSL
ncbi:hypothetical protein SAY86_007090 [Trapa natans]|uniref:Uncharacterized protein n=1 Tax=Trapa natans TaxID=22666 RepID=A0AAN7QZU5_TRANT|nr:hypothetical protein SAY86_007090 [Trapa natans]